ncbi:uncharacterized protein LOC134804480 [Cydia splendana]|uniref:uncharacterized protein LOC134804480 n=1 Tax=Cydia splendana TaxID=1100963 RepID=UPI00300D6E6F
MNQYVIEKRLCICYGMLALLLTIAVVFVAIPFNHWRTTLNVCPGNYFENTNCGCIFYGVTTYRNFNGGHHSRCMYATLAPVPILIYAIIMALFHMYRVCINNVGRYEDEKSASMQEIEGQSIVVTSRARVAQRNDSVIYCWVPSATIGAIFCIYNLVHAAIITDGFVKTCNQYRSYLVTELRAAGDQTTAIHFRLSCQAIYDYMDYIQKNPNGIVTQGEYYINTGLLLQLAIIASWVSVALWMAVVVFTTMRAYKERHVLTCCGQ